MQRGLTLTPDKVLAAERKAVRPIPQNTGISTLLPVVFRSRTFQELLKIATKPGPGTYEG